MSNGRNRTRISPNGRLIKPEMESEPTLPEVLADMTIVLQMISMKMDRLIEIQEAVLLNQIEPEEKS